MNELEVQIGYHVWRWNRLCLRGKCHELAGRDAICTDVVEAVDIARASNISLVEIQSGQGLGFRVPVGEHREDLMPWTVLLLSAGADPKARAWRCRGIHYNIVTLPAMNVEIVVRASFDNIAAVRRDDIETVSVDRELKRVEGRWRDHTESVCLAAFDLNNGGVRGVERLAVDQTANPRDYTDQGAVDTISPVVIVAEATISRSRNIEAACEGLSDPCIVEETGNYPPE